MLNCESDIYEEFATVPDERTHLLVRCCHDRCLVDGKTKLYQTLQQQELAGSYSLSLPADKRKGRKQREAKLEVRFCQVKLKRPSTLGNDYPKSVTLYAVEARECQETIAEGEEAIHWRLLSTHEVDSYEKALQLIIWYSWRFFIEQLFRTLKRQGLELEATELESGKAIIKLAIFGLHAALRVMQLVRARDGSEQAVDVAFTAEEQACLADLAPRLEGSTGKQANPHPLASLAWASWLIARLGGWNGYASERPAGVITMYRGLKQFQAIFLGWQLARENDG